MVTALMNPQESFPCPTHTPSTLTASTGPWTSKRPTRTTNRDSKKPRPVLEHQGGASRNRRFTTTRGTGPVAVTLEHGAPQVVADDDSVPQFRVPAVIDVTALAAALDAQLNGADVTDEVDGFLAVAAGAFAAGMAHQRSLVEVA